ncbi:hypothetical protein RRF57_009838 [Xylaria bambusicola]|uniref:Uncharacterized protein n=1 Tax=Xylaria bambusicola TaxID=326684 RepID=A0AAN7V000_9PEZI
MQRTDALGARPVLVGVALHLQPRAPEAVLALEDGLVIDGYLYGLGRHVVEARTRHVRELQALAEFLAAPDVIWVERAGRVRVEVCGYQRRFDEPVQYQWTPDYPGTSFL